MRKIHLIKDKAIRTHLNTGYLPAATLINYLINNVEDFKNIKLNKDIKDVCLLDLNIIEAKMFGHNFEYELMEV